jgi:hypothetical protein
MTAMSEDTNLMRSVWGQDLVLVSKDQEGALAIDGRYYLPKGTRDLHEPGAKDDSEKLDLTLPPPELIEAVAEVMQFGLKKYSRNGWKAVSDRKQRYQAALMRHMNAILKGEELDPESGLSHMAHVATNAAFLLYCEAHD